MEVGGGAKNYIIGLAHMTKMATAHIWQIKTLKIMLQDKKADDLGT